MPIRTIIALSMAMVFASTSQGLAAIYVVTSTSDDGSSGTLRWAVNQANSNPGFDRINFNIPGGGVHIITLASERLAVSESVDINAKSQPGYTGNPLIHIDVNGVTEAFLLYNSTLVTIQGFIINGHSSNAITIFSSSSSNWIQDNWIGFDANGTTDSTGFEPRGIGISSNTNVIRRNVISGVANGITIGFDIYGSSWDLVQGNSITSNYIGLDPTGTFAIENSSDGIFLGAGATQNWLGPDNVISGNASAGVELLHMSNQWNVVFSNTIGLNAAGDAAIPNGELGVQLSNGASRNAIGGPWGGNVISGNNGAAVMIGETGADPNNPDFVGGWGNWIQNNVIGLDGTSSFAIPNLLGIHIRGTDAYWNTIGENLIAGNSWWGIYLQITLSNWIDQNNVGEKADGTPFGNGYDGVLLQSSAWNTVINNLVRNNGWASGFTWQQIRESEGSHTNDFFNNTTQ